MTLPILPKTGKSLILSGDVPLINADTLIRLASSQSLFSILTVNTDNPFGMGRIICKMAKLSPLPKKKMPAMHKNKLPKSIAVFIV